MENKQDFVIVSREGFLDQEGFFTKTIEKALVTKTPKKDLPTNSHVVPVTEIESYDHVDMVEIALKKMAMWTGKDIAQTAQYLGLDIGYLEDSLWEDGNGEFFDQEGVFSEIRENMLRMLPIGIPNFFNDHFDEIVIRCTLSNVYHRTYGATIH